MQEKNLPLISVIMPAFNAQRYIEEAIRSVQNQTYPNWELLVIDDGSSDDTCRIVQEAAQQDLRIQLHRNPQNMGTAQTRNRGLDLCNGKLIALLDSDDVWHPEKLEKQYRLALSTGADIVYTSYAIIDENGAPLCDDFLVSGQTDFREMLKENVIGCSTVMLSGDAMKHFRFSREFYHEDYVLWMEMLKSGRKAAGVREVCVDYRVHSQGRASNKLASAKRRWMIYRSALALSVPASMYYMGWYMFKGLKKYRRKQHNGG